MIRRYSFVTVLLVGGGILTPIRAEDFSIDLQARAVKQDKTANAKYPSSAPKAQPRAVLMAGVNGSITVKWTVRYADKTATVKDTLVHCFVVKQEKPDQADVPKLTKDVIFESALTMDFKALDKAEGEFTFTIPQAGSYLLRLEIKGTTAKDAPFAALDLVVQ